jgi:uncharacterized membrane protein
MMSKLKSISFWYFAFFITLNLLPIIAPVARSLDLEFISKPIYFIYSFTCHQFHSRSLHIHDNQYAWCARDTGIWLGFLIGAILYRKGVLRKIKWYQVIIFILPILIDGLTQTIFTFINIDSDSTLNPEVQYVSNNLFRFVTGSFFGLGLSLFITPNVLEPYGKPKFFNFKNAFKKLSLTMLVLLFIYISLVQIWSLTSSSYKPTNLLDSEPKIQTDDFFLRRKNGDCPTDTSNDVLALNCFFNLTGGR